MSYCSYKNTDSEQHDAAVKMFLSTDYTTWDLLSLQQVYAAGNSIEDIRQIFPFRNSKCSRSKKCCGLCTRRCKDRCLQDCLHRLHMWKMLYDSTKEEEREHLPLGIRMIVLKKFETGEELSWAVGEILSCNSNTNVKEYMKNARLYPYENPYKLDYAPQVVVNRDASRRNNALVLQWPVTGLCPFCVPKSTSNSVSIPKHAKRASKNSGT